MTTPHLYTPDSIAIAAHPENVGYVEIVLRKGQALVREVVSCHESSRETELFLLRRKLGAAKLDDSLIDFTMKAVEASLTLAAQMAARTP